MEDVETAATDECDSLCLSRVCHLFSPQPYSLLLVAFFIVSTALIICLMITLHLHLHLFSAAVLLVRIDAVVECIND